MKDLPVFTTQNGVASLTLREIPYTAAAYILLQDSLSPQALLDECRDFCRAVGAEHIYASGDPVVEAYPYHTAILTMRCRKDTLPPSVLSLWPVQEHTVQTWRDIYNRKAARIPNAAWMTDADCRQLTENGDGYFVHNGKDLLGIGRVSGNEIKWLASCAPGAGEQVLSALASIIHEDTVCLQVADANKKAMQLYEHMGFITVAKGNPWHRISDEKNEE